MSNCVVFLPLLMGFAFCASSFMSNKLLAQKASQPLKLPKNTSAMPFFKRLCDFLGNATPTSLRHTINTPHSLTLHSPKNLLTILECEDSKILESQADSSPADSTILESNATAEAVCDDFLKRLRFVGCEALSARSYLSGSAKAREANSRKSAQTATQILSNSKIVSEKCGGSGKSQGSYLKGNDRRDFSPLPHLSPQAELLNFNIKDTQ
nr:hypothetical protein [uncultured Helicobacter sp.]